MSQQQVSLISEKKLVGQPLKRLEDHKFLSGAGKFLDDLRFPNLLYAGFVRSSYAHARIVGINIDEAVASPGVFRVLTGKDIDGLVSNLPTVDKAGSEIPDDVSGEISRASVRKALPADEVNYSGEAVAVVLATDKYSAEDAVELVHIEYEQLEPMMDPVLALNSKAPKVHEYLPDNLAYHHVIRSGDVEDAFRRANHTVKVELLNQRVHPMSLEPRGIAASFDDGNQLLTVWISTQDPQGMRSSIAESLKMNQDSVRVVAPDVGGAFGGKGAIYPEDIVIALAAKVFERPVLWEETRTEHMLTMTHGRGQNQWAELAFSREGKILGLKIKLLSDAGAYSFGDNVGIPELTGKMGTGAYNIPAYEADIYAVFTNKVPHGAYRGAGRPEATYLIERALNIAAQKLNLDVIKIRQLNFIKKTMFPHKTPGGYVFDSGDYDTNLRKALDISDYYKLREFQRQARASGRLIGIGLITWVEVCGFSPSMSQTASITVDPQGRVKVNIGGHPHGQGHAVAMAQIVADELGIPLNNITVQHGDTNLLPWSSVTAGSRSGPLTGSATFISARKIRDKMSKIAALQLHLEDPSELSFENSRVYSKKNPDLFIGFSALAGLSYNAKNMPSGIEPTLFEYTAFAPSSLTFPFGTHIAVVEVDRETGSIFVLKYFCVDDCGKIINPMLVEGQVIGGVVQGIGQAILEEIVYDESGQLLTSTLSDYTIPTADLIHEINCSRTETPTSTNPLGVKGIGEAGAIAATPVIVNAVEDALSEYGVVIEKMPLKPEYLIGLMRNSTTRKRGEDE